MRKIYSLTLIFVLLIPTSTILPSVADLFQAKREAAYVRSLDRLVIPTPINAATFTNYSPLASYNSTPTLGTSEVIAKGIAPNVENLIERTDLGTIEPLPIRKPLRHIITIYDHLDIYKYDSVAHTFVPNLNKSIDLANKIQSFGFDPVRFTMRSNKNDIAVNEEIEITISAEFLNVSPRVMFTLEGSTEYTLKMLMPEGFIQTGGTYYDFINGKVNENTPKIEYTIKGYFEKRNEGAFFRLLRSHINATEKDIFISKGFLPIRFANELAIVTTETVVTTNPTEEPQPNARAVAASCAEPTASVEIRVVTTPVAPTVSSDKNSLCDGESATLTAVGCSGTVTWNNGLNGKSISVSSAGSYKAFCSSSSCVDSPYSSPVDITTGNTPEAPVITTNKNSLCGSETATLTISGCQGTINWSNGSHGTTITMGVGTYSATCSGSCGTSGSSNIIVITSGGPPNTPSISTNWTEICNQGTVTPATLTATGCNASLKWSTGQTTTSITVPVAGTYSATCENECGETISNLLVITIGSHTPPVPLIGANKVIVCPNINETATLTAIGCPGTVIWSTGGNGTSISVSSSGTYTSRCSNACGTSVASNPIIIYAGVPAPPLITAKDNITSLCPSGKVTLVASDCTGDGRIVWNNGVSSASIDIFTSGSYRAQCVNACGVSSNSDIFIVTPCSSSTGFGRPASLAALSDKSSSPYIAISGNDVCSGNSVTLEAKNCAGSISWCINGVINSNHTATLSVNPTQTTTYKLLCEFAPELSAQSSVICAGTTTILNTSGCSGESVIYQIKSGSSWLSHATGSPAVANFGVSAGIGTYRAICVSGGVDSPYSNEVTITNSTQTVPVPTVSIEGNTGSSITVCGATGAAILKASGCSGGTITWSNGQVGQSMVISATGNYSAKCTQYCGTTPLNSAFSSNLTVTYQPVCDCNNIAITTNTINGEIPERSTLVLSVPEITGATYRWFGPNLPPAFTSPTLTIPNVSSANSGGYSVLVSCRTDYLNTTINVTDIDECANSFSHFAYSLSPNGEVGVGEELRFVSDGGDKYEWTGPNGFYSKEQFPTIKLATLSNNGYYTVKISKLIQGTWCDKYVNVVVKIGNCTFDAGPTYSETTTDFQLQMWANKPLEGATFEWLKGTTTVSTIGNPTFPKNAGNTGTYTLKVNLRGCTVEKSVKVDFVSPPLYDGHLDIATCDEVSGWILDENNKNKSLSYTIKIKIDNNEIPYTVRSDGGGGLIRFRYVDLGAYKDGLPHNVVVYLPNGTQLRNTTLRSFTCCNLEFNTLTANSCVPPATTGSIAINMKASYRPTTLQYYLEKQERDEDGNITYKPTGVWQVPTSNQYSFTFSSLVPGPYRVTAREGSNGCTIKSGVSVFCENNPGCNNTNVVIFPTGEIKEGVGIIPKLYANVLPEQNSANPDKGGMYLDGTASVSFTNYNYMYGNLTLEAWVNPKAGSSISVGDASDASRQRYLFRGWNGGATDRAAAQVSVGSNGINLIEEGDSYRRVALSYEGILTGWNHIAVVYQNNLPTLLINGQVVASSTIAPPLNIEIVGPNSVGTDRDKGFIGSVYGFRVWNTALDNAVVNQNKTNFDPLLAASPNVGFWVFDKLPTGNYVEDLSSGKRQAKLEGHAIVLVPPVPVQPPNAPIITWWLAGIKVATGNSYTVPANKVKAGTLNYIARYQKTDGTYCDTAVPVVIAPANYGSLSGCYIIKTAETDPKPIAPYYNPNTSAYKIKKGYSGQGSEKEIWRFEHLGSEIYRINSAFFNDMALEGLTNEVTLKNKRVSEVAQQWKANVVNASALTFSLVPQNNLTKRLHYDSSDTTAVTLSANNSVAENFIIQPTACPLPAGECNSNGLITYERWLEARLQSMPGSQWTNLNVAQYITENTNPYTVQVGLPKISLKNATANTFPGRPTAPTWQDSRYVNRLSGYICPPKNGDYTFYIKTDEWAELWMSTDEDPVHKRLIAKCTSFANNFISNAEQRSLGITLTKGRSYYFEVILKDEINSLDAEIAWQVPDAYVAENLLQPMPLTNISSIPRSITPSVLTVSASSLKVAATENVTLTATGCNYGRVIWKAGLEVVQNPTASMPTLTRQGPGIYQAMCVGDYTVNQDWVMVKVDINGSITPIVTGGTAACPTKTLTLTATGAPNGYSYEWFTIKTDPTSQKDWRENHSSMPNIFDNMPNIFNKTTQNTLTVTGPGTYYIRIVNSNGYQSPIKEYTVLPAIPATVKATNDSPTPEGNPLVLTATDIAGATYAWTGPNGFTANTRTATRTSFDASMAGIYTITITTAASAGGCSVTATTEVIPANCDIYIKTINPANNQETYSLPRKVGGGFDPLSLKIENIDGTTANLSPYNVQWMLNGNPMAGAPNAATLSTDKIGEYVAVLSLKMRPENTCEAKVNINAIPCKVYDGVPTCGTAPSNIEVPSTTAAGITLAPGDKFTVADYTVVVTEITSGGAGGWNGKGYIEFRLINNIAINKVAVLLENAVVNECYQLAGGKIVTQYDESWGNVLDVDAALTQLEDIWRLFESVIDNLRGIEPLFQNYEQNKAEIVSKLNANQADFNKILESDIVGVCATSAQISDFKVKYSAFISSPNARINLNANDFKTFNDNLTNLKDCIQSSSTAATTVIKFITDHSEIEDAKATCDALSLTGQARCDMIFAYGLIHELFTTIDIASFSQAISSLIKTEVTRQIDATGKAMFQCLQAAIFDNPTYTDACKQATHDAVFLIINDLASAANLAYNSSIKFAKFVYDCECIGNDKCAYATGEATIITLTLVPIARVLNGVKWLKGGLLKVLPRLRAASSEAEIKALAEEFKGVAAVTAIEQVSMFTNDLAAEAVNFRKTLPQPNHGGNVVVIELTNGQVLPFTTGLNIDLHTEFIAKAWLESNHIPLSSVKRIFSELEFCELENSMCKAMVEEMFPNAIKQYAYPYPGGNSNIPASKIRQASKKTRKADLTKLLAN